MSTQRKYGFLAVAVNDAATTYEFPFFPTSKSALRSISLHQTTQAANHSPVPEFKLVPVYASVVPLWKRLSDGLTTNLKDNKVLPVVGLTASSFFFLMALVAFLSHNSTVLLVSVLPLSVFVFSFLGGTLRNMPSRYTDISPEENFIPNTQASLFASA